MSFSVEINGYNILINGRFVFKMSVWTVCSPFVNVYGFPEICEINFLRKDKSRVKND